MAFEPIPRRLRDAITEVLAEIMSPCDTLGFAVKLLPHCVRIPPCMSGDYFSTSLGEYEIEENQNLQADDVIIVAPGSGGGGGEGAGRRKGR